MTMTENSISAQASDEPMRAAFFAWFADHGGGQQYKESQDAFCAGYRAASAPLIDEGTKATPRAKAEVERDVAGLRKIANQLEACGLFLLAAEVRNVATKGTKP